MLPPRLSILNFYSHIWITVIEYTVLQSYIYIFCSMLLITTENNVDSYFGF